MQRNQSRALGGKSRALVAPMLSALIALPLHGAEVLATDPAPRASIFSLSGFGTLGAVHSSESEADFVSSIFSPNGAGYTRSWSPDVDSRIGAQATAVVSQFSAVVQVIAEQNFDGVFRPHVEWANVKYQITPDFNVRLGRTGLPSFLYSDTRKIGYANPWVRPPVEAYSLVPIDTSDGVDASYKFDFGGFLNTLVAAYGNQTAGTPSGRDNEARRLLVIADTLEHGAATVHLAYQQTYLTVDALRPLFEAFRQFGPQGIALADKYGVDNRLIRFIGLGAMYDPGAWFVVGEWGVTDYESVLGKNTAWYVSGGVRLAKFTPYLTYGAVQADGNTSDPGLTVAALPPNMAGSALGLNAALNSILQSSPDQRTFSVGMRWDFFKNLDFKVQADHSRLGADSPGTLINLQPGFRPGGTVNLFSAVVDFVF
jgi:hypothetical protein